MTPFLKQVAGAYCENERDNMLDYCFVFPNKRSGVFFKQHLSEIAGPNFIMPEVTTISDFISSFSPLAEASRYEQLFTLYNEYHKLSEDLSDFDKFQFWGELLLGDFNDIDRYLVDPAQLFVNVERLKEINANYFTEEQIRIIERYWSELPRDYDPEEFWRHVDNDGKCKAGDKFLKLWQVLLPLYRAFRSSLESQGLSTSGMYYRNAVEKLSGITVDELPYKRYIFVGFNVLSVSEISIFDKLKALGMADFYWDYNSPAFRIKGNRAGRFMSKNVRHFKSLYDLEEPEQTQYPTIEIVGVSSDIGQVKMAGRKISEWASDNTIHDVNDAVDTAIVLPDENLFIPMIHSIPEPVTSINVTMGYPMRHTSIATLMRNIVSMHLRAQSVKGKFRYFYEDLKKVLTHPLINSIAPAKVSELLEMIIQNRMFTVDYDTIVAEAPELAAVFAEVSDVKDIDKVADYTRRLIETLLRSIDNNTQDKEKNKSETYFLQCYLMALDSLCDAAKRFRITMRDSTFFHLLERAIGSETINFTGEPLKGLQVMGVLETRALDFENIIILSMNERIFPSRHFSRSFIPDALRRAYGLSTIDFQESIYSYYFYRLISRAGRVVLLYNANSMGEMSRYLAQLLYMTDAGANVSHRLALYGQSAFPKPEISVRKNRAIMEKLSKFTSEGEDCRYLSASSINDYINCPLNFYLKQVERYNPDDDIVDYIDSATYGTILHAVAEKLYTAMADADITADRLANVRQTEIEKLITKSINHYFKKRDENDLTPLAGSDLLIGKIMLKYIRMMLECEQAFVPYRFYEGEYKERTRFKINDRLSVNLVMIIDRIDRVKIGTDEEVLRIVDYKTGGDVMSAKDVGAMFDRDSDRRPKAMFQLFLYSNLYAMVKGYDGPIQPYIYKFTDMFKKGLPELKIDRQGLKDYRDYNDEFLERFKSLITEIFDENVPFVRTNNTHSCKYCKFKTICGVPEED